MQIINNSQAKVCKKCKGKGQTPVKGTPCTVICYNCNGTGIYQDTHFILVGNGIAIDSDMAGK